MFLHENQIEALGHIRFQNVIQVNPKKITAVTKWEAPTSVKQVQSVLGLRNYYESL